MNIESFNQDFEASRIYKQEINEKITKWIDAYEGKPYGNEAEGRSNIVWKLIKKHGETLKANLAKPFISNNDIAELTPKTSFDVYKAKIDEKLVNYYLNKEFELLKFIKTLVPVCIKEGTSIIKVSEVDGKPYSEVCYNEDIFTDPDAHTIQESEFIIHRFGTTEDELQSNGLYDSEKINSFFEKRNAFYEAQQDDMHERPFIEEERESRPKVYLYEYWFKDGEKIHVWTVLSDSNVSEVVHKKEWGYKWFPFIEVPFYDEEFSIWGRGLADIIEDEQKFMTSIVRGVIDNMSLSNNGIKFIKKGSLDSVNYGRLIRGEPVVEVNTNENIASVVHDGNFNELPASVYNMLQVIEAQAEGLTGVSRAMQGISSKELNSPATNYQMMMSQSQIRLLDIESNIAKALEKMVFMWIEIILKNIDEKTMFEITGTTWAEEKAKLTKKLMAKYDVDNMPPDVQQQAVALIADEVEKTFDLSTLKYDVKIKIGTDGMKQAKIQQINMLMQQAAPLVQAGVVPPDVMKELTAELFDLLDFPEIAKKTRSFQQQPDPMQQKMFELEMMEKEAKAQKEMALAKNAMARTQLTAVKANKEQMKAEPEILDKYADIINKTKEKNEGESASNGEAVGQ